MYLDISGQVREKTRPWITLYSQTGSEIVEICKRQSIRPDLIFSSKTTNHELIKEALPDVRLVSTADPEWLMSFFDLFHNPIITLHGWLKILPEEICNRYEIYNGHPGLITEYPSLKGKDPQKRAWEEIEKGNMKRAGCVIHKVIPEVDDGEVLLIKEINMEKLDFTSFMTNLRSASIDAWTQFLKLKLYDK